MKILYLDYDDQKNPYANGGQAHTTSELTERLSKKHQITIVTGNYPRAKKMKKSGVRYVRLGIGNLGFTVSLLSHWLLLPLYVSVNQPKYDVVLECLTSPFTVSLVPLVSRKPLIAIVHFFDSRELSKKYNLPLDILQKVITKKYRYFIVFTKDLQKRVLRLHPSASVSVIPGGIDSTFLKSRVCSGKYALYLGRIDIFNKGLDLLLEAWKNIPEKLIIAGPGQKKEREKILALIRKNKLQQRVVCYGRVTGQRKIDLYRKSSCVVQPSRYETFGYVALEAIASGKLLVCSDIPGFKWIPNSCALKVKRLNAKQLQQTIEEALGSTALQRNMSKTGRNFAKQFSWDRIAEQYHHELERVHQ